MDLGSGSVRSWPLPEPICWIVERAGRDDFIVGLKRGFASLSLDPPAVAIIGNPEPDMPHNRLNDAKVDRWGRVWAGTMPEGGPGEGALYRLDPDLRWMRMDTGYRVANGPTFSLDGTTLYHADTPRRLVYAMTVHADGHLSDKRIFLRFGEDEGVPDGMTTDAAGGIWICHWDGGRVSRFRPDGTLDRTIRLPVSRPTSPCFAGPGACRLFVASASIGREAEAMAGSLFEIDRPGVFGRAPTLCGLSMIAGLQENS